MSARRPVNSPGSCGSPWTLMLQAATLPAHRTGLGLCLISTLSLRVLISLGGTMLEVTPSGRAPASDMSHVVAAGSSGQSNKKTSHDRRTPQTVTPEHKWCEEFRHSPVAQQLSVRNTSTSPEASTCDGYVRGAFGRWGRLGLRTKHSAHTGTRAIAPYSPGSVAQAGRLTKRVSLWVGCRSTR